MSDMILDHKAQAIARLPEQYKNLPRLKGLIEALVDEFQELETVFFDLRDERALETAVGVQLDRLGDIVGQDREPAQSDEAYRLRIKTRIIQNISQGEPERVITVYQLLTGAELVFLSDGIMGGVILMSELPIPTQDEVNALVEQIKLVAPAAVRVEAIGHFDEVEPFAMDGSLVGEGFGTTTDLAIGGKFGTIKVPTTPFAFAGADPKVGGFGTVYDPIVGGVFVGL